MGVTIKTCQDLEIWKKSMDNCVKVYKITEKFPRHELYGLTSQIRRSAISIPANIAEGYARRGQKEFKQFLSIALGSSSELETHIILARKLEYLTEEKAKCLLDEVNHVGRMTTNFYKSI